MTSGLPMLAVKNVRNILVEVMTMDRVSIRRSGGLTGSLGSVGLLLRSKED